MYIVEIPLNVSIFCLISLNLFLFIYLYCDHSKLADWQKRGSLVVVSFLPGWRIWVFAFHACGCGAKPEGQVAGMKVPASPWWAVGQQRLNLCYLQSGQTSPLSWSAPRQLNDSNKAWLLFTARNAHSECSINIFYLVFIMTFSNVSWQTKIKDVPPTYENTGETAGLCSIYSVAKEANYYL